MREIDAQAVEACEYARKNNELEIAAKLAGVALGLTSRPLSVNDVWELSEKPEQAAVLACIARIHVDSLKSLSNKSIDPWGVIENLERALYTLDTVYRNRSFRDRLGSMATDHRGREHFFEAEMPRDEAKTLQAAAVLYRGGPRTQLLGLSEAILQRTYNELPVDHPTRPLIGIELQFGRFANTGQLETEALIHDFNTLNQNDRDKNPHRVATVASWMVAFGVKHSDSQMRTIGENVFDQIVGEHPEWGFMVDQEIQKLRMQNIRNRVLSYASWIVSPVRRADLHWRLTRT